MGCVYIARNKVNGKAYIGKTNSSLEKRKKLHEEGASVRNILSGKKK